MTNWKKFPQYCFCHDSLEELGSLHMQDEGFSLDKKAFLDFARENTHRWSSLSNVETRRIDCPFCNLKLGSGGYKSNLGTQHLVSSQEYHEKLLADGFWLLPKRGGWHHINEMIGPNLHMETVEEFKDLPKLVEIADQRWFSHRCALEEKATLDIRDVYYGLVVNRRAGQSVQHLHFHCYSSSHALEVLGYFHQRHLLLDIALPIAASIYCSDHDSPNLLWDLQVRHNGHDMLDSSSHEDIVFALERSLRCLEYLYSEVPPCSIGVFFRPHAASQRLIVCIFPLQWRGTIQAFQGSNFYQFEQDEVRREIIAGLGY